MSVVAGHRSRVPASGATAPRDAADRAPVRGHAENMAGKLLEGGDAASSTFGEIVEGLLSIEDSTERNAAAIALFGEPLNDLGTERIPAFLESLQSASSATGELAGRADELGATLNSNTKASVQSTANSIQQWIVGLTEADGAVGSVARNVGGLAVAAQPVAPMMTGLGLLARHRRGMYCTRDRAAPSSMRGHRRRAATRVDGWQLMDRGVRLLDVPRHAARRRRLVGAGGRDRPGPR